MLRQAAFCAVTSLLACTGSGDNMFQLQQQDAMTCPNDLPSACPAAVPSYQTDIVPLIMNRCYPCHGPGGVEQATHDYSTYQGVYLRRREILDAVHSCIMPPAGSPAMTSQDRAVLFDWLVCGAPNN